MTILQRITNSIIQFVQIVTKILKKHIPHVYLPFMNDINIKGPKTIYNNEEIIPEIRKYILKHIIWINRVLADLERAEYTISGAKSQFCIFTFRVIKFIYDTLKRHSDIFKIIKIMKWPSPNNITEIKAFIKVAIYYKRFIKNFALIAA
jgi:hypothetical protein